MELIEIQYKKPVKRKAPPFAPLISDAARLEADRLLFASAKLKSQMIALHQKGYKGSDIIDAFKSIARMSYFDDGDLDSLQDVALETWEALVQG